jgi:deoxycytidylate deaminase
MKSDQEWVNLLMKMVRDLPRNDLAHRARHASAIVYRDHIVGFGINQMKSHPLQAKFRKNPHAIFLHSEVDSIKNSLRNISLEKLKRSTLYVVRIKEDHITHKIVQGLARPCEGCARAISAFEINRVVWTMNESGIGCNKIGA